MVNLFDFEISKKSNTIKNFSIYEEIEKEADEFEYYLKDYSVNELKFLNYIFYSLQKKYVQNEAKLSNIISKIVWNELHQDWFFVKNQEPKDGGPVLIQTLSVSLEQTEIKHFLNFTTQNYIPKIKKVVHSLMSKHLKIYHDNSNRNYSYIQIFNRANFIKNDKSKYDITVTVDVLLLLEILKHNQKFIKINVDVIQKLTSKYAIRFYEEFTRISEETKDRQFIKSQKNLNKFLGTNFAKQQDLHHIILRVQKELLKNKLYKFDYEKYKNIDREWIYKITNITKFRNK